MSGWAIKPGETPFDLSRLRDKSIETRAQLDRAEAANIAKAVEKYMSSRLRGATALSYDWFLRLHRDMFCDVWDFAGKIRTTELTLGAPPERVPEQLGGLVLDIAAWQPKRNLLLEQTVRLHHRAVHIHPFENGNGRWARLAANLWLRRHGAPPIDWPPAMSGGASDIRDEYIHAIRLADKHDYSALTSLHQRYWQAGD